MAGTIEVLIGSGETQESYPSPVVAATPDEVPVVVKVRHGITGLVPVAPAPPNAHTDRVPVAAWTATTDDGRPVEVRLWEEMPFDETVIGKALAQAGEPEPEPEPPAAEPPA